MARNKNKNQEKEMEQPQVVTDAKVQKVEELEAKVSQLEEKVQALEDVKLRLMAEFDNYRRRTQKEKLEMMDMAGERILADMLPLIDDFERALKALQATQSTDANAEGRCTALVEGVDMIYQKFIGFLAHNKVSVIETEGKDFSTDEHEAVTLFAAGEDKKGKIIDCTQKGYKLGEKVIRYAKVVVGE